MLISSPNLSRRWLIPLFGWIVFVATPANAADLAYVLRTDGRWVSGEIDVQTDNTHLWMRSPARTFRLVTAIPWEEVAEANIGNRRLLAAKLREEIDTFKSVASEEVLMADALNPTGIAVSRVPPSTWPDAGLRVESLEVEAWVDNWDQDAEADGIAVRVLPRNVYGDVVPASGQLLVTAIGRNQIVPHDSRAFPEVGRWSVRIDSRDFLHQPAVVQLPFQASQSDVDFTLQRHALVTASLFVAGQGRFEAQTVLYLRTFNPVRDDLLRRQGLLDR